MTDHHATYLRALERVAEAADRFLVDPSLVARMNLEAALQALDRAKAARP